MTKLHFKENDKILCGRSIDDKFTTNEDEFINSKRPCLVCYDSLATKRNWGGRTEKGIQCPACGKIIPTKHWVLIHLSTNCPRSYMPFKEFSDYNNIRRKYKNQLFVEMYTEESYEDWDRELKEGKRILKKRGWYD